MIIPLPSLALAATLLMPVAESVPRLNVEPSCRAAAKMGENLNARLPRCLEDEASARAQLEADWTKYSRSLRQGCTVAATAGGSPSYVELLECLMMRRDALRMEQAERDAAKIDNAAAAKNASPAQGKP